MRCAAAAKEAAGHRRRQLAASGGYIAALAADHIVAQQTSLVGSIGVLFQFPNVSELLDKIGVKVETIKSSPLKAAPDGFEPTSPEARAAIEFDHPGFLRLVQRPGAGPPPSRPTTELQPSTTAASSPAIRARLKLIDELGDERDRASPGSPRRRTSTPSCRCATMQLQSRVQRPAVPARRRRGRARCGRPRRAGAAAGRLGRRPAVER